MVKHYLRRVQWVTTIIISARKVKCVHNLIMTEAVFSTEGRCIGFRCFQCNKIKKRVLDTSCYQCHARIKEEELRRKMQIEDCLGERHVIFSPQSSCQCGHYKF